MVSSLVNASSGSADVFGIDVTKERSAAMRQIGLVPQEMNFTFFEKPLDPGELLHIVSQASRMRQLEIENRRLREEL